MRKSATMTINDKIITINEITVKQLMNMKDTFTTSNIYDAIQELIPLLSDASPDFLLELAPSELEDIYEKVKEVNGSFFRVIPLDKILAGYRDTVMESVTNNLYALSARSLPLDTELPSGTTDGDYSANV